MSSRKSVPINTQRRLWADCGGFCQNPNCNKYLFVNIEDETVSIANMAHIIGVGSKGPRKEHELADYIEENGFNNLIMLCLECHKVIDELEKNFSVESIQQWKHNHSRKIRQIFKSEYFSWERELLIEIDQLLDENKFIFSELLYNKCNVYLFGSYLRQKIFNDIDLLLVYKNGVTYEEVDSLIEEIKIKLSDIASKLHFECCSVQEFPKLEINYHNKQRVF